MTAIELFLDCQLPYVLIYSWPIQCHLQSLKLSQHTRNHNKCMQNLLHKKYSLPNAL